MRVVKLNKGTYRRAEKISKTHGIEINVLISQALNQGLEAVSEKTVLELYENRKITLQKAAEMLSIDIWDMIEKLKRADIHIDYSKDELAEDLK
jgi:predicted HTH domain antitoxin